MRLDAWLKQPHTPVERLRLIERLAQALNTLHDQGETLASVAPERVEVGADLKVDLSPASRGRPEPGYAAPERLEGGPQTTASDIYSVGALCWEILMGRPCGEAPRPLADAAPELPRELANSVMGCLEKGAEWRPKDLTYLAQLAAAQQKVSRPQEPAKAGRASGKPERAAQSQRASSQPRSAPRRPSRSLLPLFVAAALLVAAAASSYFWLHRQETRSSAAAAAAPPTAAPVAAPPEPTAAPTAAALAPAPTRSAAAVSATPTSAPRVAATPAPEPETAAAATPPPTPTPAPVVATPLPRATETAPVEPALLSTLSPLTVKRPGRVLLDIRGTGLRSDLRVSVLPLKQAPRGITVVRQKWASANLVSVLLELDESVAPAAYAIALEDASGYRTNPLSLTITK